MPRTTDPDVRRRNARRRVVFYGGLAVIYYIAARYNPYVIEIFPRPAKAVKVDFPSQEFFRKGTRVAIVTAHPDDAEFYIGGTLSKLSKAGADIQLIIATDGDKRNYWFEDWKKTGEIRRAEATEASKAWHGRYPIFLGFPDGGTTVDEPMDRAIGRELVRFDPQFTLIFDGAYAPKVSHLDHRNAGASAEIAARRFHVRGWLMRFSSRAYNWCSNISDEWDTKSDLLAIHRSQFQGVKLDKIRAAVYDIGEKEGALVGVELAEGFRCELLAPYPAVPIIAPASPVAVAPPTIQAPIASVGTAPQRP